MKKGVVGRERENGGNNGRGRSGEEVRDIIVTRVRWGDMFRMIGREVGESVSDSVVRAGNIFNIEIILREKFGPASLTT
jgi:hypothetical protein